MVDLTVLGEESTPLLTFYPGTPQFSCPYPTNYSYSPTVYSFANIENTGWCYADFNLTGFDDQISSKYCTLDFEIWGLQGNLSVNDGLPLNPVISGTDNITDTGLSLQISGDEPVSSAFKEIRGLSRLRQELINDNDSTTAGWMKPRPGELASESSATSAAWVGKISLPAGAFPCPPPATYCLLPASPFGTTVSYHDLFSGGTPSSTWICFISMYSSTPMRPNSLPMPLCL